MDIKVRREYLEQAMALHKHQPVVDAHLDLAGEILMRHESGEREVIKKYYLDNFRKAGIKLVFSSIFVENENSINPLGVQVMYYANMQWRT